jgi:hypothetical protein
VSTKTCIQLIGALHWLTYLCLGVGVGGGCGTGASTVVVQSQNKQKAQNNVKNILLAVHEFHDRNKELPNGIMIPPGSPKAQETEAPRFSWRVEILPHFGTAKEKALYEEFDFSQPWDSPHNLKVAEKMPDIYRSPSDKAVTNHTGYLAIADGGGAFPGSEEKFKSFSNALRDGLGMTIAVVEVQNSGIIWTAPQDLSVDEFTKLIEQGKLESGAEIRGENTWVAMLDGTARRITKGTSATLTKPLATADAGDKPPEAFPGPK